MADLLRSMELNRIGTSGVPLLAARESSCGKNGPNTISIPQKEACASYPSISALNIGRVTNAPNGKITCPIMLLANFVAISQIERTRRMAGMSARPRLVFQNAARCTNGRSGEAAPQR